MASGSPVTLGARVIAQGELAVGSGTVRLKSRPTPCSRIFFAAPTSANTIAAANDGALLIGAGNLRMTITGQPADKDTVTLNDGSGNKVYEFDNDSAYTAGRIQVVIGADKEESLRNLVFAINQQATATTPAITKAQISDDSVDSADLLFVKSASESVSNFTIGSINLSGGTLLELTNTVGYDRPYTDASQVYVTGFNAGDVVEYQIFG